MDFRERKTFNLASFIPKIILLFWNIPQLFLPRTIPKNIAGIIDACLMPCPGWTGVINSLCHRRREEC